MSEWENGRRNRINTILEILRNSSLQAGEDIWLDTRILYREMPEITKNRFLLYLTELEWAGLIVHNRNTGKVKLANWKKGRISRGRGVNRTPERPETSEKSA